MSWAACCANKQMQDLVFGQSNSTMYRDAAKGRREASCQVSADEPHSPASPRKPLLSPFSGILHQGEAARGGWDMWNTRCMTRQFVRCTLFMCGETIDPLMLCPGCSLVFSHSLLPTWTPLIDGPKSPLLPLPTHNGAGRIISQRADACLGTTLLTL